jgi:hypothetical protein
MPAPKTYECPIQGYMTRSEILSCKNLHDGENCYAQADIICSPRMSSESDLLKADRAQSSPSCTLSERRKLLYSLQMPALDGEWEHD